MKTPEDAVSDAVVHPLSRLMILLFGTWLIGSLHPIPETVYYLIRGPVQTGPNSYSGHTPEWFEFYFLPVLGGMVSKTALVSGPISVFCIVCSALDRWNWLKVTMLSGISTFAMLMVVSWAPYNASWIPLTLAHLAIMALVIIVIRPLRQT
jgi:hypothetical protein